jgi:hypothetical protein
MMRQFYNALIEKQRIFKPQPPPSTNLKKEKDFFFSFRFVEGGG